MKSSGLNLEAGALALVVGAFAAPLALAAEDAPIATATEVEAVTVTALRQETDIQATPVQVTAISGVKLQEAAANQMVDLTYMVPSMRYQTSVGSGTQISMRGIANPAGGGTTSGGAGPAVTVYFQEVAVAGDNAYNTSPYDMANVQVLQGPQGTLFGRNTIGGAILLTPVLPSFDQNAYVKAGIGSYNYKTLEGAANFTLVEDVLAVRAAAQLNRRDGYVRSLNANLPDQANVKNEGVRFSVLFTPMENLRNVTVLDYYDRDDSGTPPLSDFDALTGESLITTNRGVPFNPLALGAGFLPQTALAGIPNTPDAANTRDDIARAMGYPNYAEGLAIATRLSNCNFQCVYYGRNGLLQEQLYYRFKSLRIFNTTTWEVTPNITLKNTFGYQDAHQHRGVVVASLNTRVGRSLTPAAGSKFDTATSYRSLIEEIQVQGRFFDDRVRGIAGYYYSKDYPHGDWYNGLLPYNAAGTPSTTPATQTSASGQKNVSRAIFGNIDIEIIKDRLTFHGGGRLTWDDALFCTLGAGFTPPGTAEKACANGVISTGYSEAPTWSFGLDWQATDDLFFYAVTRRGYRSSGIRSNFESPNRCTAGQPSIYNANPGTCTNDFGVAATFTRGELLTLQRNGVPITPAQLQAAATGFTIDLRPVAIREPETVTDVEVGMRSDWNLFGWRQRLNVTYFHYKYSNVLQNLILGTPNTNFDFLALNTLANGQPCPAATPRLCTVNQVGTTNGGITVNAGEAVTDGVQASLTLMPVTGLTVDFSGSWIKQKGEGISVLDSEVFQQLPSSLLNAQATNQLFLSQVQVVPTSPTPEWSYSISARYVLPFHPADSDIILNYNYFWTDKWTDAVATYKSYDLHNVRLSWNRVAGSNVDLGFWVRNLTNKAYIQGSASAASHANNFGEPRMMGFDLTLNFR